MPEVLNKTPFAVNPENMDIDNRFPEVPRGNHDDILANAQREFDPSNETKDILESLRLLHEKYEKDLDEAFSVETDTPVSDQIKGLKDVLHTRGKHLYLPEYLTGEKPEVSTEKGTDQASSLHFFQKVQNLWKKLVNPEQ